MSKLLEKELPVLDHGYVKLIEYMGNDEKIARAARRSVLQDGKKKNRPDEHLIDYLMRNGHHSPMEANVFTIELEAPLFVMAQIFRHRTFSYSSLSLRYSSPDELHFYVPTKERVESAGGSVESFALLDGAIDGADVIGDMHDLQQEALALYRNLQDEYEWPSELARGALPVSMYTNVWMTGNLRNFYHFLKERLSSHAQYEVRVYAERILEIVRDLYPVATASWENHVLNSLTLSRNEAEAMLDGFINIILPDQRHTRILMDKIKEYRERLNLPESKDSF